MSFFSFDFHFFLDLLQQVLDKLFPGPIKACETLQLYWWNNKNNVLSWLTEGRHDSFFRTSCELIHFRRVSGFFWLLIELFHFYSTRTRSIFSPWSCYFFPWQRIPPGGRKFTRLILEWTLIKLSVSSQKRAPSWEVKNCLGLGKKWQETRKQTEQGEPQSRNTIQLPIFFLPPALRSSFFFLIPWAITKLALFATWARWHRGAKRKSLVE